MDKQKEVIDDVDVEWMSTDSSNSSSDNEELMSTIRRSRFEHEFQHSQMGAGTSNEASERSRPATTSGEDILSIPPIARLTEPPRRLSTESFLRTSNPRSVLTESDLSDIRGRYGFPNEVQLRLPFKGERADTVSEGWIFDAEWDEGFLGIDCAVRRSEHRAICRRCARDILSSRKFERSWMVLDVPAEEEASKELKKPPPKALLFEEKLERLLALPNREWDDIQVPKRLRASSLWKDFIELPSGIPKRVPSWVDWPFIIRGALRRLFGTPLFVDPLTDEEALIAEFALDSLDMEIPTPKDIMAKRRAKKEAKRAAAAAANAGQVNEPEPFPVLESSPEPPSKPSSPPAKKRKVVEKAKTKILAKRKLKSKIASPESDVEGPRVEVVLPPRLSLLNDRQASVDIARQLLSEVDAETLTQGSLQDHMDDIMWETMKVVSQSNQIKELEENDRSRRAKLEDIERKFVDVKSGSEGLMLELQKSMDVAREGTSAMDALVRRFEENQDKVKSLEAENAALASQIMNAFEKATFKARYDILKDYKAGLLDETQIDEEIEMFEEDYPEEVRSLSSVPSLATTEAEPANLEPPAQANPSEVRETRK
ncbi:hypothetical protein TIFTF001_029310 [Ficus carica]|uniref:Uncharacterized protein n=1 Tax=Ficus carica TaxID=3494 RepID=A0AA88J2P3_FICCA|nr:hypothetical protein TIFTF001_029310 [Ficus carica]